MSANTLLTIEEELSIAYLHAVCARAGVTCIKAERALDNDGIDAMLKARFPEAVYPQTEDVYLEVQLKATVREPGNVGTHWSYWLKDVKRYDVLRRDSRQLARVLVVLFLPRDTNHWLRHSEKKLVLRHCAYWTSLRNAPPASTRTGATVRFSKTRFFSPENLSSLMLDLSKEKIPQFENLEEVT